MGDQRPGGYAGGLNLYEYCGGDPVNGVDEEGLQEYSPTYGPHSVNLPSSGNLPLPAPRVPFKSTRDTLITQSRNAINDAVPPAIQYFQQAQLAPGITLKEAQEDDAWVKSFQLLQEWANGTNDRDRIYYWWTIQAREMMCSQGVTKARRDARSSGKDGRDKWKTKPAADETFNKTQLHNATIAQVGAYTIQWTFDDYRQVIRYEIKNDLTVNSFFYHLTPARWNNIPGGQPMATIHQRFIWVELWDDNTRLNRLAYLQEEAKRLQGLQNPTAQDGARLQKIQSSINTINSSSPEQVLERNRVAAGMSSR